MLVVVSLILLTDYFGESPSSPLHTLQRGIVEVFSPIQQGASTVLSPIRDIGNWFSDTFKARSQVAQLKSENQKLILRLAQAQYAESQLAQLSHEVHLDRVADINAYHPVAASVTFRNPGLFYQQMEVDKGSDDGVRLGDPVVGDRGLVGKVSIVGPTYSEVTLITDPNMAVAAAVESPTSASKGGPPHVSGDTGVLEPAVGDPNQLELTELPTNAQGIKSSQLVVTVGYQLGKLQGLYPPGIPIGVVTNFNPVTLANNQYVKVTPLVDLQHLDTVQILTSPHPGDVRAQVP